MPGGSCCTRAASTSTSRSMTEAPYDPELMAPTRQPAADVPHVETPIMPRHSIAGCAAGVAGASIDDHRGWVDRMRAMASAAIAGGVGILVLVLAATVLSVAFATRGAMAANRPIVEVLHFIGARDAYIAGQFQSHFLKLGLKGGFIGGGAALILLTLAGQLGDRFLGTAGADQTAALFGSFS